MKDKENQIKLLIKRISKIQDKGVKDIPNFTNIFIDNQELAEEILKYYQPKLPEHSVVLLKEEYESLKNEPVSIFKNYQEMVKFYGEEVRNLKAENKELKNQLTKERKETAEKVIVDFYHELVTSFKGRVITYDSFCKIAQKHNVEIPRETFTLAELKAKNGGVEV